MSFKYKAFISYSHQDADWGVWLHKALETYSVPRSLVGTDCRDGSVPKRLFPIFRDREELPTATDLGRVISQALKDSGYLIVICSPRSAGSMWVNEEILSYKRLGRENRILAIIVDGEPNASDKPGMEADECFPEALKYKIGNDGNLTTERTEPIAADARTGKDGKEGAKLKLLAGLLGVSFDSLNQREKKRQKIKRLMVSSALVVAGIVGSYFWQQYDNKRIEGLRAESETLTLEAVEQLEAGNSKSAITNLLKALPMDINNPDRPILEKTKSVLNRAVYAHRELLSFQGPEEEVKELRSLKNGELLVITETGDVYSYNSDGALVHQFTFDDDMEIYVTKDEKTLVAAAFTQREEKGEGEFATSIYPRFFVSKSYDLTTGKMLSTFEKRYEKDGPADFLNLTGRSKHFLDDGKTFLGRIDDYSNQDKPSYQVGLIDVATGEVKSKVKGDNYISKVIVTKNGTLVSNVFDSTIENKKQLGLYFAKLGAEKFTALWPKNDLPACRNGKSLTYSELNGDSVGSSSFGLSKDENHLVVIVDDVASYGDKCLFSFDLTTGEKTQMFSTNIGDLLKTGIPTNHQFVLDLAYNSEPLLLHFEEGRRARSVFDKRIYSHKIKKNAPSFYAYADASNVYIKGLSSVSLSNQGVNVTAMTFNYDASQLWIAGIDGRIRLWRSGDEMETYGVSFDGIDKILVGKETITAINNIYLTEEQRSFDFTFIQKSMNSKTKTINLPLESDINHLDTKLYGDGTRLGVMKNRHVGFSINRGGPKPAYWLHIYNPITGEEVTEFEHNMGSYNFPKENGTHIAYTFEERVFLVSLSDGSKSEIQLPEGLYSSDVVFIGEKLLVSTFDKRDDPNTRKSALYITDDKGVAPLKKIAEKQAQSLKIEPNTSNGAALLHWDIVYQDTLLEVITEEINIHSVQQTWEDEFGLDYLLSENGQIIYGVQDEKSVKQYNLMGEKMAEKFSNQSWFEARLGPKEKYLINKDNFLLLSEGPICGALELSGKINADNGGRYLVVGGYEKTHIYDLTTCQIIRDLPFSDYSDEGVHLDEDGTFWVVNNKMVYKVKTQSTFLRNVNTARRIIKGDKK